MFVIAAPGLNGALRINCGEAPAASDPVNRGQECMFRAVAKVADWGLNVRYPTHARRLALEDEASCRAVSEQSARVIGHSAFCRADPTAPGQNFTLGSDFARIRGDR